MLKDYRRKKLYVETIVRQMLQVKTDFSYIKYAKNRTDTEYIRIGDLRGNAVTLDVTTFTLENIMFLICDYVINGPTGDCVLPRIVVDTDALLSASKLFKEVA